MGAPQFSQVMRIQSAVSRKLSRGRASFGSLPGRINGLGDQEFGVGAGLRMELLHAPGVHFGDVQIPFLVHAHPVDAPQATGKVTHAAPAIQQVSLQRALGEAELDTVCRSSGGGFCSLPARRQKTRQRADALPSPSRKAVRSTSFPLR
jgi:hypothetical protein